MNRPPNKVEYFDSKDEAVSYAKSQRHSFDAVRVNSTERAEEVIVFRGDDMYQGNKRTRLQNDE